MNILRAIKRKYSKLIKSFLFNSLNKKGKWVATLIIGCFLTYILIPEKIDSFFYGTLNSTKPYVLKSEGERDLVYRKNSLDLIPEIVEFYNNHLVQAKSDSCSCKGLEHSFTKSDYHHDMSIVKFSVTNNSTHSIQIASVFLNILHRLPNPRYYPNTLPYIISPLEYECELNSEADQVKCSQTKEGIYIIKSRDIEEFNLIVRSISPYRYLLNIEIEYILQGKRYLMEVPGDIVLSYYTSSH